jgi:hypothetical protein
VIYTILSKIPEMSEILELLPNQTRQYIDAETVFLELRRARSEATQVRGSMFWRTQQGKEYLIRESAGGAQKSLGPRSADTEEMHERFKERKAAATSRLAALTNAAHSQERMNKALRVGRVPGIVIKTLNALEAAGLQDHFITIGTHALYAFEAACGVRCAPDAMATQDIDLLFDARKRLSFMSQLRRLDSSFIGALRKADPSFRVMSDQKQTAINDAGFEVDVIRRIATDKDPHPLRMSDDENDLWAVQVKGADRMLSTPGFSQVVVSETGRMAVMNTMDPLTFIAIKKLIAASPTRDPRKRAKDALQARLVEQLVRGYMPQYQS